MVAEPTNVEAAESFGQRASKAAKGGRRGLQEATEVHLCFTEIFVQIIANAGYAEQWFQRGKVNPRLGRETKNELSHRTKAWRNRGIVECEDAFLVLKGTEPLRVPTVHEALGLTECRPRVGSGRVNRFMDNFYKSSYWR